jgi:hypothetical protein
MSVIEKLGEIVFLLRWCKFTGFSCMEESFILKKTHLKKWVTRKIELMS